ncbi:MAG: right-handed parallel beta-helix repeat-containing protein [Deltaproteobacteria bacterium]|nr:right-handed parallel beta-helix repeat-containing protein [Deltaproteobacteria bacterium]
MTKATSLLSNAGDIVVVGPGTYAEGNISPTRDGIAGRPIRFIADTSGAQTGDPAGAVTLAPAGATTTGFLILGRHHIVIDGFTVTGASDAGIQVRASPLGIESNNITIRNVTTRDGARRGIDIAAYGPVTVLGCTAQNNHTGGISIQGTAGNGATLDVESNVVSDNGDHGFLIAGATDGGVTGNVSRRNNGDGFLVRGSSGLLLNGNTSNDNREYGIGLGSAADRTGIGRRVHIEQNFIERNAGGGINAVVADSFVADQNRLTANGGTALSVDADELTTVMLTGNQVGGGVGDGLFVTGAATIDFEGNSVLGVGGTGLLVRNGRDVVVNNNQVAMTGASGINVAADGSIGATANAISAAGATGLTATALAGSVELMLGGNGISGSASHGIFVSGGTSGTIGSNSIHSNQGAGIVVRDSAGLTVAANTVQGNQAGGLEIGSVPPPPGSGGDAQTSAVMNVNFKVLDNQLSGNARSGIRVVAGGQVEIDRNRVLASPSAGVAVIGDDTTELVLDANDLMASGSDGMSVSGLLSLAATRNSILDSVEAGLRIRSNGSVTVRDNLILRSGQAGIDDISSGAALVSHNVIEDSLAVGASLVAESGKTISLQMANNQVRRTVRGGVFLDGIDSLLFDTNEIEDSGVAGAPDADGVALRHSGHLRIRKSTVRRATGRGLAVGTADDLTAQDVNFVQNIVTAAVRGGIVTFCRGDGFADSNVITHSQSVGVSLTTVGASANLSAQGNTIGTGSADGLFISGAATGSIRNNILFSNAGSGLTLRSSANMTVANNLIYANGFDGVGIGTGGLASPNATVVNNTIYENGRTGVLIDAAIVGTSGGARILNNIFQGNVAGGIGVARSEIADYVSGFNVNVDGYTQGTRRNGFDINGDPMFIRPAGGDGVLGGDGYADDDFHLPQRRAGQAMNSVAVDAGSDQVSVLGVDGSTATTGTPDVGKVDVGFHYGATATSTIRVPLPFMPIFVRSDGTDANDGRSPTQALATFQKAMDSAVAGATVVAGPGRYAEGDIRVQNFSGKVTFWADSSGRSTGELPGSVLIDAGGADTGFVLVNGGPITIAGFQITGAAQAGIQVRAGADGAILHDNVVFSNQRRGIEVAGANRGEIRNNLVYANGTGGIRVAGSRGSVVTNNTVYANSGDGILIGGSADSDAAPGATVVRNVVIDNGTGIKVEPNSFQTPDASYVTGYNVVSGGTPYSGNTPRADSDFIADPLLADPAGPDHQLGGTSYRDDDFHLRQDDLVSPAVDIDFSSLNELAGGTTRSDGLPDLGPADSGYHYPFLPVTPESASFATVLFVRSSGNDASSGVSADLALGSVARALAVAADPALVVIGPGHYREGGLRFGANPSSATPMVLLGDVGGQLTGDAPGSVELDAAGHSGAVAAAPVVIDGMTFSGSNSSGLRFLPGAQRSVIHNSTVCGNAAGGISIFTDGIDVLNNLVGSNGGDGVRVALRRRGLPTRLLNNSVTANLGRGIVVSDTTRNVTQAELFNNVIAGNAAAGIALRARRGGDATSGRNLNIDGYAGSARAASGDINSDPLFAGGTPTPSLTCSLSDSVRVTAASPVLDAGNGTALDLALARRSVRADGMPDSGPVDLGYHYPLEP